MDRTIASIRLFLACRRALYRFEKRSNPEMRHNWRIALLCWLDKRMTILGRHALSEWLAPNAKAV
jgi:hypothetical protein